ncbi:MAG: LTA synthase family protein [Nitrospirae bacterium]|nr:LTA synthase family protein [Nitrospirota bacterium]
MREKTLLFVKLLLLFVLALFVGRAYFFLKYLVSFSGNPPSEIVLSFLRGVRFDLSTACIVSIPFFVILLLPGMSRNRYARQGVLATLLLWYVVLLVYNFIDIQYYAFAQRHVTFELKNAWGDTRVLLGIGLEQYVVELLGLLLFLGAFTLAFRRLTNDFTQRARARDSAAWHRRLLWDVPLTIVMAAFFVVFIRGGLQAKPLGVKNAFSSDAVELGILSLNGIYTTFNALAESRDGRDPVARLKSLHASAGTPSQDEVVRMITSSDRESHEPDYPLFRRFTYPLAERKPLNVVIFVLESWSAKFIGALNGSPDATPVFDELSRHGLLLTNCFANAQRSIEGLSALLGSVPVWKGVVLGQGGLLYQTRLEPIGHIFKNYGYETVFIHGARHGSMGFDGLTKRVGFTRHISRDDFEINSVTDDGVWGIYDEYSFLRAHHEFEQMRQPFFSVVYSLSSHTPYTLPSKAFERFAPSVPHREFLNSMGYSDDALGKFFSAARTAPYFRDTVFLIVADHTEGPSTGGNLYEGYHIPCLLYSPAHLPPGREPRVVSQLDLAPTLLDFLRISAPYTSWGKSIFADGDRVALLPRGDHFVYVREPYLLLTDLDQPIGLYDYRANPAANLLETPDPERTNVSDRMNLEVESYLRFSYDALIGNKVRPAP